MAHSLSPIAHYNDGVTIAILGAGEIGGETARQLAVACLVSRVVLIDEAAAAAAGKALDITQSIAIEGSSSSVSGTGDESAVVGAGVLVIADRLAAPGGEWSGEAGLALLRRVSGLDPLAPVLCAGGAQASLVEQAVGELGLSPARVFGTAPEGLRSAVTALVALEAEAAPADVALSVLGRAPDQIIVPWEAAAIAGRRSTDVLSPPAIRRLEDRLPRLWPPSPITLAAAAASVIRSMLCRLHRSHALLAVGARDDGAGRRPAIMPARVDRGGIAQVETPSLSGRDRVRLETVLAR
jgi:hypothetical protein